MQLDYTELLVPRASKELREPKELPVFKDLAELQVYLAQLVELVQQDPRVLLELLALLAVKVVVVQLVLPALLALVAPAELLERQD